MRSVYNALCLRLQKLLWWSSGGSYFARKVPASKDYEEYFKYTSGRWLWDEDARLKERYRRFNIVALQDIAASHVGADRCISMSKLAEGGFNKIFRLTMNNNAVVIARIPNSNAGLLSKTIASEVATMDFASRILGIPVPAVLSWDSAADNAVQSEYILMEEASGTQLGTVWNSLEIHAKAEVVDQLAMIAHKLLSVSFSYYGNIYFSADKFEGCQPAIADGTVTDELKAEIRSRYVIGPAVERSFWDGERHRIPAVRGPWSTAQEYLKAIATREITWLSEYAKSRVETKLPFLSASPKQEPPERHIALYQKFQAICGQLLPADPELVRSTLWHWDLHAPNIFVTGTKITSIIDWQDSWAGPLVLQADSPRLVKYQGEVMLKLPPHYESLEDGPEKQETRSSVEKSLVLFRYISKIQRTNPEMKRLYSLPHEFTIREAVTFAANTWDDGGIIPFREILLRISRDWNEICPNEPCPFEFTAEEIREHQSGADDWNAVSDFWSTMSGLVGRDGFVLHEDYDEAFEMFVQLRETGLKTLEGDEREEFAHATSWAVRK